jgi:GH25 family lysozyme M1 (1,4-beta-N-acetylmuramidase)
VSAFVSRIAFAADVAPRRRRGTLPLLLLVAAFALALIGFEAARPTPALALSTFSTKCDGVVLRSKASTSSTRMATLSKGIKVVAVDKISGGSWKTVCAGTTSTGSSWLKITVANGKDVRSRFGVSYVYAASSLFKKLYSMSYKKAACDGVNLRASSSTSGTRKASLSEDTKVTVIGTVSGGSWSASCDAAVSGSSWYKISQVDGKSVSSLYGVSAVYGAKGLFTNVSTDTPASTPAPTPTPDPTTKPTPTPAPSSTPSSGYIEGIDVSHWQNTIDWAKVASAGKKFAFIKATESTDFVDNMYATNRAKAKANGIRVGAYHFARPGTNSNDAVNEANWFIKNAGPVSGELLPVLDLEVTGGLTDSQLEAWTKAFMDRVYALTGVKGAIYVSPSFWSNNVGNSTKIASGGYKVLWVAHWTSGSSPTVPGNNWNGNGWTFWQYTSSGTVAGIGGRVDLNRYRFKDFSQVTIP